MYCRVYNTLNQSRFWLGTIRELMADLTTINARISPMSFVEFVVSEFSFGLVPRVVPFEHDAAFSYFIFCQSCTTSKDFKSMLSHP